MNQEGQTWDASVVGLHNHLSLDMPAQAVQIENRSEGERFSWCDHPRERDRFDLSAVAGRFDPLDRQRLAADVADGEFVFEQL